VRPIADFHGTSRSHALEACHRVTRASSPSPKRQTRFVPEGSRRVASTFDIVRLMAFSGFSKDTARFIAGLRDHNDKSWFEAHRGDYEAHWVEPAKAFVSALEPGLRKLEPAIHAEPRLNGSLFRIHRDTRFSKDKKPYKDHLDLWFWTGDEKGWDSSGFFFRLTPDRIVLGTGMHGFEGPLLARYREAVLDEKRGKSLATLVEKLRDGGYAITGESYKKVPAGVDKEHPRAALLRHGGLTAGWESKHPKELSSPALVDFALAHFRAMTPLHRWLRAM
jgi:uncharacterized protein (TIGR02453 family)